MSATNTWCVYTTRHPTGVYYTGKSSLERIDKGYQGSGRRLHCAFLHAGFEPATWKTEIVGTFISEDLAYAYEATLVTLKTLCDPFCLNETPGGKGSFRGSAYALILKQNRKKRTKSNKKVIVMTAGFNNQPEPFWLKGKK